MWVHAPPRCSPGAARAASVRGDVGAAVNLFGRANALAPESDRFRKLLLVELGTVLYQTGELARARGVLDEAVVLARQTGDAHVEWRARILQSFLRMRLEPEGAGESALAEAELAMRALAADDDEARGRVWHLVAVARGWRAELDEQARAAEEGLRHARRARNPLLEAELLRVSVPALVNGPVPVQEGLRRVEAMLERSDDVQAAGNIALHLLGHLRARVGDFDGAREAFSTWRQHLQELGNELAYAASAMCIWDLY